jgi:hypothetical protein
VRRGGEGDGSGGVIEGLDDVVDVDAGRRDEHRVGIGRVHAVEADQGVEVHGGAALELGGFAVGELRRGNQPQVAGGGESGDRGQTAGAAELSKVAVGGLLGAVPQFGGEQIPHDVVVVVVAVATQRPTERGVVEGVACPADRRLPVLAQASVAAGMTGVGSAVTRTPVAAGVVADFAGVHGAEAGGGQGEEHAGMVDDAGGDAFAADQERAQNLEGVALVGTDAGGADRGEASAAGFVDGGVGQLVGVPGVEQAPGGGFDGGQGAGQPDRAGASGGGLHVRQPAEVVGPGGAGEGPPLGGRGSGRRYPGGFGVRSRTPGRTLPGYEVQRRTHEAAVPAVGCSRPWWPVWAKVTACSTTVIRQAGHRWSRGAWRPQSMTAVVAPDRTVTGRRQRPPGTTTSTVRRVS